ncbi:MlaC/ttg2D family ABC transporter substrate-binding protein [Trinickia diaoshuihuensis]|jgi:phospholipid transport system substrate-binding protein|uniref:MlaC/ttg2D family ABC transporter substrate-binding protein n=1 Tax=Trinickia diaoshuihuensis TaxID=2292265 RepID=UPI000E25BD39|nr:ABC transporter substrate-binding protein [Trinickia diaoshuihuensis]
MKKFLWFALFSALLSFGSAGFAQTVDTNSPDGMIKTVTTQVLDQIKSDSSIKSGDINKITQVVNEKILPYTDFRRTTQLAMGRAWRQATPQQQDQMVEQFKMLLIRTYSGALSQVRDQTVQFKPFRADPGATDVVVRSTVINNSQPVELDYRLYKTAQGWRVYDLNVAGAWLIQAYQQQFAEKINQGGVSGLLQFLTQRNEQLAAGKQPS